MFDQKIYSPNTGEIVTAGALEKRGCISASAQAHLAFVRHFVDLGFTHLIFHSARPDRQAFLEAEGRDVLTAQRREHIAARWRWQRSLGMSGNRPAPDAA